MAASTPTPPCGSRSGADDMRQRATSYRANGEEVRLEPTELIAVDLPAATETGVSKDTLERIENGRHLRKGIVLLNRSDLSDEVQESLEDAGVAHPVYRDPTGALTVVLPEVRVEADTDESQAKVRAELEGDEADVEVVEDDDSRFVLRPASGRGIDALELANNLYDRARPAMSQPRLLRLVDRPEPA